MHPGWVLSWSPGHVCSSGNNRSLHQRTVGEKRPAREIHDDREALSDSTTKGPQIPAVFGSGGTGGLHDSN